MLNKKAGVRLPWEKLIGTILLLISVGFIATLVLQSKLIAEEVIPDDVARTFVKVRCGMKEKTLSILSAPLPHSTKHRELPLKGDKKEDFMRDLGSLVSNCWYQFNDGNVCDNLWEGFFALGLGERKCFICYTFDMQELKDAEMVTDTEFYYWMNNNLKFVEESDDNCENKGGFCIGNKKEDEIKFRDERDKLDGNSIKFKCEQNDKCKEKDPEKNICCYSSKSCLNKGGICADKSFIEKPENKNKYNTYNIWDCPGDEECFVDAKNYYTHLDYIQGYGASGTLLFGGDINFEPHSNFYTIAFTNKIDKNWPKIKKFGYPLGPGIIVNLIEQIKKTDEPYEIPSIIVSKLNDLEKYCYIQKDIKGR